MNAIIETINSAGRTFVEFALPMFIQSSVLILILLALDVLLRRRVRAVFRYWLWMLVLVKLVLPPSLWSPVSIGTWLGETLEPPQIAVDEPLAPQPQTPPAEWQPQAKLGDGMRPDDGIAKGFGLDTPPADEVLSPLSLPVARRGESSFAPTHAPPHPDTTAGASEDSHATISWQGMILVAWAAVVLALLLLLLQRAWFVRGLVAQAQEAPPRLRAALDQYRSRMGLTRPIAIRVSPNATSPAVCGLLRPAILIPQNLAPRLQPHDLQAVLLHELAHVKRGDLWVNLIQTLLQIVYFYNPLLWLANAMIRRAREQAVDEAVLVAMGETAPDYPETLLHVAKLAFHRRPALSLRLIGVVESRSALRSRIKHILARPFPKTAKLGLLGLVAVFLIAAVLLPMAKARPLTDRARSVMSLADEEARRLNHDYVGTEHILLALARQEDAVSAKVLVNLGADLDTLRAEVNKFVQPGTEPVTRSTLPRMPRAERAMQYAKEEAKSLGHDYTGTEHILLALLRDKEGVAARVLAGLGITETQIRAQVLTFVQPGRQDPEEDNDGGAGGGALVEPHAVESPGVTAKLPNSVTVEFLAYSQLTSEGLKWWTPEGKPTTIPGLYEADVEGHGTLLALRIEPEPEAGVWAWRFQPPGVSEELKPVWQVNDSDIWLVPLGEGRSYANVEIAAQVRDPVVIKTASVQQASSQDGFWVKDVTPIDSDSTAFTAHGASSNSGVPMGVQVLAAIDSTGQIHAVHRIPGRSIEEQLGNPFEEPPRLQVDLPVDRLAKIVVEGYSERAGRVKFRNLSLRPGQPTEVYVEVEAEQRGPWWHRSEYDSNLEHLARLLSEQAGTHGGQYPDDLAALATYFTDAQRNWFQEHVVYLVAGEPATKAEAVPLAYERTLLPAGFGTYVLFGDGAVRFRTPDELVQLGITQANRTVPRRTAASEPVNQTKADEVPPPAAKAELPNGVTVEFLAYSQLTSEGLKWWTPDGRLASVPDVYEADVQGLGTVLAFRTEPEVEMLSVWSYQPPNRETKLEKKRHLDGSGVWLVSLGEQGTFINIEMQAIIADPPVLAPIACSASDARIYVGIDEYGILRIGNLEAVDEDRLCFKVDTGLGHPQTVAVLDEAGKLHSVRKLAPPPYGQYDGPGRLGVRLKADLPADQFAGILVEGQATRGGRVRIRNLSLDPDRLTQPLVEIVPAQQGPWWRASKRFTLFQGLAQNLTGYAKFHNGRYPDSLSDLDRSGEEPIDRQAVYLGSGKKLTDNPRTVIAYEKTLLPSGCGTYVAYSDGDIQFNTPAELEQLGITQANRTVPRPTLSPQPVNQTKADAVALPAVKAELPNGVTVEFLAYSHLVPSSGLQWLNPQGQETTIPGVYEADVDGLGTILALRVQPPEAHLVAQLYRGPDSQNIEKQWQLPGTDIWLLPLRDERSFANLRVLTQWTEPPVIETIPLTEENLGQLVAVNRYGIASIVDLQVVESFSADMLMNEMGQPSILGTGVATAESMGLQDVAEPPMLQFSYLRERGSFQKVAAFLDKEGRTHPIEQVKVDSTGTTCQGRIWPGRLAGILVEASAVRAADVRFRNVSLMPERITEIQIEPAASQEMLWKLSYRHFVLEALTNSLHEFCERHGGRFPGSLADLQSSHDPDAFRWISTHMAYIGQGKSLDDDPRSVIAYDQTLLAQGQGTYVLYSDGQLEFEGPVELAELGLLPPNQNSVPPNSADPSSGDRVGSNATGKPRFTVHGVVTDASGRPMEGVWVNVDCGFERPQRAVRTLTDEEGRYTLGFESAWVVADADPYGVGIQPAFVYARKDGFYETSLCHKGNLAMAGKAPGPAEQRFVAGRAGVVLVNEPYELNFVMAPAALLTGQLVDADGRPMANHDIYLHSEQVYPLGRSYLHVRTHSDGTFGPCTVPCTSFRLSCPELLLAPNDEITFARPGNWRLTLKCRETGAQGAQLLVEDLQGPTDGSPDSSSTASLAWQRTDRYVPPDPNVFFPDDPEGGKQLDALFQAADKDERPDEEIFSTVRQGLRRTTQHRTLILQWIGNRYVWGKDPQNPRAVEILYHAVPLERHYAVYFGLSVVRNKTPNVLRTLADICMEGQEVGRTTWGLGDQREMLLAYISPHLQDSDPAKRQIAEVLVKHFKGELDFEQWQRDKQLEEAKANFSVELPQFRETLLTGGSGARYEVLSTIQRNRLAEILEDSFVPALRAAGGDPDPKVRNEVARIAGHRWVWSAQQQDPNVIELMLKLSSDSNREVRSNAVYYGLSVVRDKSESVIRRLVGLALADQEQNFYGRIVWGLKGPMRADRQLVERVLTRELEDAGTDAKRAAVHRLFKDVLGQDAPLPRELSGRVVDPNGESVVGAQVAWIDADRSVSITDGRLMAPRFGKREGGAIVETDERGHFRFEEEPNDGFSLLAAHDAGFALVGSEQFAKDRVIRLQRWGRVEGQVAKGRHPLEDKIWMGGLPNSTWFEHRRDFNYETLCDSEGRFTFKRVPPGWFEVGYLTRMGDAVSSLTSRTPVVVEPGKTATMTLGGEGRPVIGRFVPPLDWEGPIYFGGGSRALDTARPDPPRPADYDQMTRRQKQEWYKQWRKTPEAQASHDAIWHNPDQRHYTFRIAVDGTFRIEDVIPGKYNLNVWLEERLSGGRPEEFGGYSGTIEVPPMDEAYSDEPLDVGDLVLRLRRPLHTGDMAPSFEAQTIDGKPIRLADYRGRFVLLNIWSPVFNPEVDRIKELHATYRDTGKLQIIGLGGTDTLDEVRKYVEEHDIEWPEIYFGPDWDAELLRQLGGQMQILLIDPDGKIVATWLREQKLTDTVRQAIENAQIGISGRIVDPNGAPVRGVQVALCTLEKGVAVTGGRLGSYRLGEQDSNIGKTDGDGGFAFGQRPEDFELVVACDSGFARLTDQQFAASPVIRLQPWGRIEGTVHIGRNPGANRLVQLQDSLGTEIGNLIYYRDWSQADEDGHFVFEKVPPRWAEIGYVGGARSRSSHWTNGRSIHIVPGETVHVAIGATGRPVVGTLAVPPGYEMPADLSQVDLVFRTVSPEMPLPEDYARMTQDRQYEWRQQWLSTPEGQDYFVSVHRNPNHRCYATVLETDDTFCIEDMISGRYELTVLVCLKPPREMIVFSQGTIDIPAMAEAHSDEPFDLGELVLDTTRASVIPGPS